MKRTAPSASARSSLESPVYFVGKDPIALPCVRPVDRARIPFAYTSLLRLLMNRRMDRVNMLVRQEISRILSVEINDPRLSSLISITEVQTSRDLRRAKVYFSVFGDENTKRSVLAALESAGGFIHRTMKRNLDLKFAPFLTFQLDESIEQGTDMLDLINRNPPRDMDEEIS